MIPSQGGRHQHVHPRVNGPGSGTKDAEEKAKRSADRLAEDETVKDDFIVEEIERERASFS